MKSCLKFLKLEALDMAKKTSARSAKQRPAGLKFVKKHKSLAVGGGRDDYLLWMNAQYVFFLAA